MKWSNSEFDYWASRVFTPTYPGYRALCFEQPDGNKDGESYYSYAHIASKYLDGWLTGHEMREEARDLIESLVEEARAWAVKFGIPFELWPTAEDSTLRLLYYPPGGAGAKHTDFCLFTLPVFRNLPQCFNIEVANPDPIPGIPYGEPKVHKGELMASLMPKEQADMHWVDADPDGRAQFSAVFFAMPPLKTLLPSGQTVGEWVEKRKKETRYV